MNVEKIFTAAKNFFVENLPEVIGAYFDGEKIFVVRLTEKFETAEIYAESFEIERLAEKISLVCQQKGWKTSAVGFCLQENDAVTYQMAVDNLPEKELPATVKSWAVAQAGADAAFSFAKISGELWMETIPRTKLEEICAAFKKFGMNLRALSVMPADILKKVHPLERTEFISGVVREKKSPNLLMTRSSVFDWKKFSVTVAAVFLFAIIIFSTKIFLDWRESSEKLDAAKISVEELREDFIIKENIDADIAELKRLNKISAAQKISPKNFNLLINLGKISGGGVRLTEIRADENFLELEGLASTPDAVKSYLSRVKNSVAQNSRLESSSEREDGDIFFVIRASL